MVSQFVLIESQNVITNVADIVEVIFCEKEFEGNEVSADAMLVIVLRDTADDDNPFIEGDEAEGVFLILVKQLPNLFVVK
jgi:hypothetical protein